MSPPRGVWTGSAPGHLLSVFPGQPPGEVLHPLPLPGEPGDLPHPRAGPEDQRDGAGARAEAQPHLPELLPPGAAGALPAPGAGQALPAVRAAHGHRRPDRWGPRGWGGAGWAGPDGQALA